MGNALNGAPDRWVRSACPYCGVGCGLLAGVSDGSLVKIKGDPDHPANFGDLCAKAVHLPPALRTADRLAFPHARSGQDKALSRVSWETALRFISQKFTEIIEESGPDAVAFYGSGQLTTEAYYLGNKLAKGFIGTNNFDTNSRLCMSSAVAGYQMSLGSDGPPASYADIDEADCLFLIGTNTALCHPVTFKRIKKRKLDDPDRVVIIVADPRRTETADFADLHLPVRPGGDIALLNGMLHVLIEEGLTDPSFICRHTRDFERVKASVESYDPQTAAKDSGVPAPLIIEAAMIFGHSKASLTLWSMGVNQSTVGVQKNNAIHNLHLATGKIGKPGSGPFSLTGQPNAMGGRETGGLSHLLPGYRSLANPRHRQETARFWGVPVEKISPVPGLAALEMFEALDRGKLRAIWILCTNPAVSMPDTAFVEKALMQAEFVVVQDAYHPTGTTQFAHVLLPAAQWPETEGVMTNSERRITYLPKITDPPGEALPDWEILARFATEMGFTEAFAYRNAADVFSEFARLTGDTPCDYSGVSYERLQREGPLQWPCPDSSHPGTPRLYEQSHFPTPDGRAVFVPVDHREPFERPDADYPLVLTTGRVKNHWHTLTRTSKVPSLMKHCPDPFVELNPADARNYGIRDADFVEVVSRRGKVIAQVRVTEEITAGACFIPFHWGRQYGLFKAANNLTLSARDPVSRQPELKACAVKVRRVLNFPERDN